MTGISVNVKPVLLIIFDGFGMNPSRKYNAWAQSRTPHLDDYFATNAHTLLQASGHAVGLPDGQFGNSEVGHLTMGAGRILEQELLRIAEAIHDGDLEDHTDWKALIDHGGKLHLVGLVSDGGVHSHIAHLLDLLPLIVKAGVEPVIHMITDGRDTPPKSALKYLDQVEKKLESLGSGYVATVSGRYWAMDRAKHRNRTERAWRAIVLGSGNYAKSAREAIEQGYEHGETDEFLKPTVIGRPDMPLIKEDEAVLFFNFRSDRARQLAAAIGLPDFVDFDRGDIGTRKITCMTQYNARFPFPVLFPPTHPKSVLAEVISQAGMKQFHCAETEKFPHVTYFFNGGWEKPFPGEDREVIPSPEVATYDQQPEMSSPKVADRIIEAVESEQYSFVLVNFANGDMVGHTADLNAVIKAVEALDKQVYRVIEAAKAHDFRIMLTADHGNCDEMVDPLTGEPHTQHTAYPVPFLLVGAGDVQLGTGRGLADIAPTILELLGLSKPVRMTGRSLILKQSLGF
ncbi:MAG TPA: 2,3-bisphosphoglycerate-independent phosphoglycerate mutase [Gammaproteobacteria bacterium]|nr:2,3-bisphosphoglycerate-independent phosphoglycerate mutase [Gammaproteobacteria bacterium]